MDDEGSYDDSTKPYAVRVHSVVRNNSTQNKSRVLIKSSEKSETAATTPRRTKYGPPLEIRLKKRNRCIIFSNRFKDDPKRALPQNKIDEDNVERTFTWLNFDVEKYINLNYDLTQEMIRDICNDDFTNHECLVCFFITHGTENKKLYANNMVKFPLDDFLQKLMDIRSLHGKSKLVFVQACRGSQPMQAVEEDEADGSAFVRAGIKKKKKKAKDADMFLYYSTTEGNLAWGHQQTGSYFIDTLCGVLQEYGGDYHLAEIVAKVNEVLAETVRHNQGMNCDVVEVGDVNHSLTHKLYFSPKGPFDREMGEKETDNSDMQNGVSNGVGSRGSATKRSVVKITNWK